MKTNSQTRLLRPDPRQRGAALIILMLAIVLSLVTLVAFRSERRGPELEAQRKTTLALAQAKEALLGRTASDEGAKPTPGRLLCPDTANTGNSSNGIVDENCTAPVGIPPNSGRLPWKTLRLSDLGDGAGEKLWYVVAKEFILNRNDPIKLNTRKIDGNNLISITGSQPMNQIVAVIIAPGTPLQGQARDSEENKNKLANYVESYVDGNTINIAVPSPAYNDRILTITAREVFSVTTQRVVGELANTSLTVPYPDTLDLIASKPQVWTFNEWDDAVTNYTVSTTTSLKDTLTLQFANCASVFTIQWDGTRNQVRRSGGC